MQNQALRWKRAGIRIGFVPTMGYLHEGHLSLMRMARRRVGPHGRVVVSLFVNPTQFAPHEDLSRYPRDLRRDLALCRRAGVDVLFIPGADSMYPEDPGGPYSTYVEETRLSRRMEGVSRPTHFRGVTTVVAKLFLIVQPDIAVFGSKDFQQAAVIQKMVKDLNFPVRVVVSKTVREKDGLALSSRNVYLSPPQRRQALSLSEAIQIARREGRRKAGIAASTLRKKLERSIERHPEARVDYIEFFDPASLEPVKKVKPGVQVAMAVFVGKTRLIDNGRI